MSSVVPSVMPSLSQRRSTGITRAISFQKQLVTSGPTPPSLIRSPYLENPHSIFNPSSAMVGGWRTERATRLTPPNEHDKLRLLDTVPIRSTPHSNPCPCLVSSTSTSPSSPNHSVLLSSSPLVVQQSDYFTPSIPPHPQRMQAVRPKS